MTISVIKDSLCGWLLSLDLDCSLISLPSNEPLPIGKYISVRDLDVKQVGVPMMPSPVGNISSPAVVENVVTVLVSEHHGSGDTLRRVKTLMQLEPFRVYAEHDGYSAQVFSVIRNKDSFDGNNWLLEKCFTVDLNFTDQDIPVDTQTILSVEGMINDEIKFQTQKE